MHSKTVLSATALLVAGVAAHGNITSPAARLPGPAMEAACGAQAISTVEADPTTPLENLSTAPSTCECYCSSFYGGGYYEN